MKQTEGKKLNGYQYYQLLTKEHTGCKNCIFYSDSDIMCKDDTGVYANQVMIGSNSCSVANEDENYIWSKNKIELHKPIKLFKK